MRLTRACGYALHALVYLAERADGTPVASHRIARARGVPERFLLKVHWPLVSAGLLRSLKDPNGGYRLGRPAARVTLLEVVEAVDCHVRGQAHPDGAGAAASALASKRPATRRRPWYAGAWRRCASRTWPARSRR
jgi:Rrf2 family protein